jgi:O-methyltransferase domain/Dimerisation domain
MGALPRGAIRPRADDRPLWDVVLGVYAYPAIFAAHRLKLFPFLSSGPRSLAEICESLELRRRPAEAMLAACASVGFLERRDGGFALTPLAEDYLLDTSPTYFGGYWDLVIDNYEVCSYAGIEKALLTDSPQVFGGEEVFQSLEDQAALAQAFTRGMHSISMAPGWAWPEALDLSEHRVLLDVGGGSGAHSIGAATKWPQLQAIVFDIAPVCEVANEFIAEHGLVSQIETRSGDMWEDPFPAADVHFYSNIFHDWPPEKGRFLSEKSFASLEPGGRIVLHEVLYDDDKTGPFATAGYSMVMLGWATGEQYSRAELSETLTAAGFKDIEVKPTFGYYSIVTGTKSPV